MIPPRPTRPPQSGRRALPSLAAPSLVVPLAAALLLSACSSTPDTPPPNLSAAQAAIQGVNPQAVNLHAPVEMQQARERLDQAEAAWRDERYETSSRLAEESLAMVRLAQARTNAAEAKAAREDVARTLQTLESEVGMAGRRDMPPAGGGTLGNRTPGSAPAPVGQGTGGTPPVLPPGR